MKCSAQIMVKLGNCLPIHFNLLQYKCDAHILYKMENNLPINFNLQPLLKWKEDAKAGKWFDLQIILSILECNTKRDKLFETKNFSCLVMEYCPTKRPDPETGISLSCLSKNICPSPSSQNFISNYSTQIDKHYLFHHTLISSAIWKESTL